jgi:hypothetical protein
MKGWCANNAEKLAVSMWQQTASLQGMKQGILCSQCVMYKTLGAHFVVCPTDKRLKPFDICDYKQQLL